MRSPVDVVVVGSGPNGLAAAALAARRGLGVVVIEANGTIGGGLRSAALTLPGFMHDVCASVLPLGAGSPVFKALELERHNLEWITPDVAVAHPLDDGSAVLIHNDVRRTAEELGRDSVRYTGTIGRIARDWSRLEGDILSPIGIPRYPLTFARFGLPALAPASLFVRLFSTSRARSLFAGCAAHSSLPLSTPGSTAFGLVLSATGHVTGWPVARGGSQSVADALATVIRTSGGEIVTGLRIERREQLPPATVTLFDTSPGAMAGIMRDAFPAGFLRSLERFRYGPGVFKVDWALREPIPWQATECLHAATVHVGGTFEEIAAAEAEPWRGESAERPFVIVTQPSVFDPSRAPAGSHTAWGYCHVPRGSAVDMTARIEAQVERFAPGFRDTILARASRSPRMIEAENANLCGGDIGGGANDLLNLLFRPTWRRYATPAAGVFLCSAATPPGGGVHGMCGYHALHAALG
ncbi:MAG TPA: NAD(P)/FAD-dependent oxidoreductase [Gemmatimonadaceae bacterium]